MPIVSESAGPDKLRPGRNGQRDGLLPQVLCKGFWRISLPRSVDVVYSKVLEESVEEYRLPLGLGADLWNVPGIRLPFSSVRS